jgi:hypothetical protein
MGYSCSRDATYSLGVIRHMFRSEDSSNVLYIKGNNYFFERGKEQADGAVTGSVFLMLAGDRCHKVGSFRIDEDGRVARFPGLTMADRAEVYSTLVDMRARNPQLLSAWSMGVL